MSKEPTSDMADIARRCVELAKASGAKQVAARAYKVRDVTLEWRNGAPEQITEATTRGISLQLFVDGRYSLVGTSDLRLDALKVFINDSVALARTLAPDPYRSLPEPELYKGQASLDLKVDDPNYYGVTAEQRRNAAKELEEASRSVEGSGSILSVTSSFSDTLSESFLVNSNGFSGSRRDTQFWLGSRVSVKDSDGRKPDDGSFAGSRFVGELPSPRAVGRQAAERALSRLGSKKGESASMSLAIDHRASARLVNALLGPLSGESLQQKRSFLEGKAGTLIGSEHLSFSEDPFVRGGFGSRLFDNEGIAASAFPLFEAGILRNYYIDNYYGRKLKMPPTTANVSNLTWKVGATSRAELLSQMGEGILVTAFLGGNSNGLTGDFSFGIQGFRVRKGQLAEPVGEMNISGNHLELWKRLVAVGNDPYPYSAMRTPTLAFEDVSVAGA